MRGVKRASKRKIRGGSRKKSQPNCKKTKGTWDVGRQKVGSDKGDKTGKKGWRPELG